MLSVKVLLLMIELAGDEGLRFPRRCYEFE